MDASSEPNTFETNAPPPQRAGLRVAPAPGQPTGVFEVIEMAVLVIVTALAMVSIIVAGSDDDGRPAANDGLSQRTLVREPPRQVAAADDARVPRRPSIVADR